MSRTNIFVNAKHDFRILIQKLTVRIGKSEARRQLVLHGISPSTADKLVRNVYPSKIGALMGKAIERAYEASKKAAS